MPTHHGQTPPVPAVPHRLSRRSFLRIGALGLGGLTLPGLLRAETAAGVRSSHKSVILIYLVGGPPHQDMFDLKPDAPSDIAGPHRPGVESADDCRGDDRDVRPPDDQAYASFERMDLAIWGPGAFGVEVQYVAFAQAVDCLFHGSDVAFSLAEWKRVEPVHDPGCKGVGEQFGLADEIERAVKECSQHDWIQIALVIRDNEGAAMLGNKLAAFHFEVEKQFSEDLRDDLGVPVEEWMVGGQIIHLPG